MRNHFVLSAAAGLMMVLPLLGGDITGRITLKGTPPPNPEVKDLAADVNCGRLVTQKVFMPFYAADASGGLADVFVTLKGLSGKSTGASAPPAVLDQKGCQYIPYVLAIQTGQTLLVKNSDPLLHNVHATPAKDSGNKEYNLPQLAGAPDLKFSFAAPEKFLRFKCDVHPWMFSYVCVEDHPYFAVSGKDGTFTIKNVPPGKYTVEATHRKAGSMTREIEVKDGPAGVDFELEAK